MIPKLAKAILKEQLSEKVSKPPENLDDENEALEWIGKTVQRGSKNPRWVLLLDDFDPLIELVGTDKTIFNKLHNLQLDFNICFVVASRQRMRNRSNLSKFFDMKEVPLYVWGEDVARRLMTEPKSYKRDERALDLFDNDDFNFIFQLTAHHPFLLQIGCGYLFDAYVHGKVETLEDKRTYIEESSRYIYDAEIMYNFYWEYEITQEERSWIIAYCQALFHNDQKKLERLSYQENIDMHKLLNLGFVLEEGEDIKVPLGLRLFLREIKKENYIL